MRRVLVTGAGGFIGHHLTKFLKAQGNWVRGADLKHPEWRTYDWIRDRLIEAGRIPADELVVK